MFLFGVDKGSKKKKKKLKQLLSSNRHHLLPQLILPIFPVEYLRPWGQTTTHFNEFSCNMARPSWSRGACLLRSTCTGSKQARCFNEAWANLVFGVCHGRGVSRNRKWIPCEVPLMLDRIVWGGALFEAEPRLLSC
ncbi:hypothetical protein CEXT_57161 [Caerostris extrusa]|uniref:Uncharacterized protein n=1 Tax=Caerostris extrusa TaxID=172846 RepID=A0AAV4MDD9_CAEEX|nr:hypothetical protein CEXT_57161 [Caerostris extrusa]